MKKTALKVSALVLAAALVTGCANTAEMEATANKAAADASAAAAAAESARAAADRAGHARDRQRAAVDPADSARVVLLGEGTGVLLSTDGGAIPRNFLLSHGLSLVRFDAWSLSDFVHKCCRAPALMLGFNSGVPRTHRSPGTGTATGCWT